MRARVLAFYRNKKHIATVQGLPEAIFPAISLSGTDLAATLDFASDDYVFPAVAAVSLDPDASLFSLKCDVGSDFSL